MAEPMPRAPKLNELLQALGVKDLNKTISENMCVRCDKPITPFRDECSRREYTISGLCQKCQDEIFVDDEE